MNKGYLNIIISETKKQEMDINRIFLQKEILHTLLEKSQNSKILLHTYHSLEELKKEKLITDGQIILFFDKILGNEFLDKC